MLGRLRGWARNTSDEPSTTLDEAEELSKTLGTFKGWVPNKTFGFIEADDGGKDVFLLKSKFETPDSVFRGATLAFSVLETEKGRQAEDVTVTDNANPPPDSPAPAVPDTAFSEHRSGRVKFWGDRRGFGFIEPEDGQDDVYFNKQSLAASGLNHLNDNDVVRFTTQQKTDGKLEASDISLDSFASTNNAFLDQVDMKSPQWAQKLAETAEDEDWEFGQTRNPKSLPVLRNYITYTYLRLYETEKLRYSSDEQFCAFNTGLVTDYQEEIFGLLQKNTNQKLRPWRLHSFKKESERMAVDLFGSNPPPLAEYFDDPTDLIFDRRLNLTINIDHIIENIHRFPAHLRDNKYMAHQLLVSAQATTKKRVYRNYKTAIPQFFRDKGGDGEIQLLLPICLERPNRADLAITVEKNKSKDAYLSSTVLTLEMAYNNARLLAKPDKEWLHPQESQ